MTKQAMLDLYTRGITPMLQVHDELVFSVETVEEAKIISDVMINAVLLSVPSKCDIEMGPNWGEIKEIDA
jgi:DNA polymerase I